MNILQHQFVLMAALLVVAVNVLLLFIFFKWAVPVFLASLILIMLDLMVAKYFIVPVVKDIGP